MSSKSFDEMTEEELLTEHRKWTANVATAEGWSSAYFAAYNLRAIVAIGNRRGMCLINEYPIKGGEIHYPIAR